tara:strand:+ start:548 stop:952 length:405 start_codon:yes stop_codon:yes gene_type:complete
MNLKKQYQRLFEGRKKDYFDKLNEAPMRQAFPKMKTDAEKRAAGIRVDEKPGFDFKYFIEQTETLIETLEEYEQEIGTQLEMKADETGDSYWKQTENQTSRYIMGAHKQLDGLLKKLQTGQSRVGPGRYKVPGA